MWATWERADEQKRSWLKAAKGDASNSPSPTPPTDSEVCIQSRRWEVRFVRRRRHQPPPQAPDGAEKDKARAEAGKRLSQLGARNTPLDNARLAATLGGYLSVPLVLYFVWTALGQVHDVFKSDSGVLIVVFAGLVTEAARWVVSGFVFGLLYTRIHGDIGPLKAISFAGLWVLSCAVPTAIARGLSVDLAQQFIYRSTQFALFMIILAVLIDLATIKSAGGTWRDLRTVYSLPNYGELVAVVAPAALLTVTMVQQIIAGSGFDVAKSFLGGIGNVIPPG